MFSWVFVEDSGLTLASRVLCVCNCRRRHQQPRRSARSRGRVPRRRSLLGRGKCRAPLRRCSPLLQHHQDSLPLARRRRPAPARSPAATTSSASPRPPDGRAPPPALPCPAPIHPETGAWPDRWPSTRAWLVGPAQWQGPLVAWLGNWGEALRQSPRHLPCCAGPYRRSSGAHGSLSLFWEADSWTMSASV